MTPRYKKSAGPAPEPTRPRMSEGVRLDVELYGRGVDPVTGAVFVKDPVTGDITVED